MEWQEKMLDEKEKTEVKLYTPDPKKGRLSLEPDG
jgi:hypothetical protein